MAIEASYVSKSKKTLPISERILMFLELVLPIFNNLLWIWAIGFLISLYVTIYGTIVVVRHYDAIDPRSLQSISLLFIPVVCTGFFFYMCFSHLFKKE